MNLLRKILLVAVAFVFACNAEGAVAVAPVLDFDNIATANITSQFQPEWSNAVADGTNAPNDGSTYIYFTVTPVREIGGPAALVLLNLEGAAAVGRVERVPQGGEHNIYFPRDGHQPTTPEPSHFKQYSCTKLH